MRTAIETVIVDGVAAGAFRADVDPKVAATAYFDGVVGAYRHLAPAGDHDVTTLAQQLIAITLLGLCPHAR